MLGEEGLIILTMKVFSNWEVKCLERCDSYLYPGGDLDITYVAIGGVILFRRGGLGTRVQLANVDALEQDRAETG